MNVVFDDPSSVICHLSFRDELRLLGDHSIFQSPGDSRGVTGRVAELVDCAGLENRRWATIRGFESYPFRNENAGPKGPAFVCPAHGVFLSGHGARESTWVAPALSSR